MGKIKNIVTSTIVLSSFTTTLMADELQTSLSSGTMSANLKTFYFKGERDNRTDREALAIGGILKYESISYYGFKIGTAFYVSRDLLKLDTQTVQKGSIDNGADINLVTKNVAGNTEMLNSDGTALETLGEAYLQYNISNTMIKFGRQRVNTPLLNDYYNRFLPNSCESLVVTNKDISDTELLAIYAFKWKYKAREKFQDIQDIMMLGIKNSSLDNTTIQMYDYYIPNIMNSIYLQFDNSKIIDTPSFKLSIAMQYLNQKDIGDATIGLIDTYLAGAKIGMNFDKLKFTMMYDKVGNSTIRGSGTDYSTMGYSKFVNFTDIQIDGEALNAGASSYGATLGYSFGDIKPALKYVHIEQDLAMQSTGNTPNSRPSSDEYNIDIKSKIDKVSKLRVRLAYIDYESTHKNEFDEINLRVIYDYKFLVSGL